MKFLTKFLLGLLLVVVWATSGQAEESLSDDARNIQLTLESINNDIDTLRLLISNIKNEQTSDRDVLVFRQDERVFRLLADYDSLANETISLPAGSSQRQTIIQQLPEFGEGLDTALFKRIDEIKQQLVEYNAKVSELSGTERVVEQARASAIEAVRIHYYESLANHIESRKTLGVPAEKMLAQLAPRLHIYAETLTGRLEFTAATLENLSSRLSQDTDNADVVSALKDLEVQHDVNVSRLESVIQILDQLELGSAGYKAVMLQQSSNVSVSLLSTSALSSVLQDTWAGFRTAVEKNAPDLIFRLLLFIAVLMVFRVLARITKRVVRAASDRSGLTMSALLKDILVSTSGGIVMALGVLTALSQVGISLAPMLAGLGVAGFIVGFALQDSLGNFAAGAMILIYRPFDVNDFVEVTGASGLVKKMNLVSTTILTFDNQTLVIPNSKIWGDVIKNVTAQKERRVDLEFGIGYGDDIELAERVLEDIVSAHEKVLAEPPVNIRLHTLADSSVNFIVRPWTKTDDYWDVYWDITREVKLRFDREGISIPFPQRDVHLHTNPEGS